MRARSFHRWRRLEGPSKKRFCCPRAGNLDGEPAMNNSPFGFQRVKVIAWAVQDIDRAHGFYRDTLGLHPAFEGDEQVGYYLGETIFMLKENWYAPPTD